MADQHAARAEREELQDQSAAQWERERQGRADSYAAVLTHLNAAAAALLTGDQGFARMTGDIAYLAGNARGSLRRVLDEPNPFVGADPALRRLAETIVADSRRHGRAHWGATQLVECYSAVLTDVRRAELARTIDLVRGERA